MRRLYEANVELDGRIADRTAELAEATRRAEAANRAKTDFLATLGHEARTPMNGVLGMLELMAERIDDAQTTEWLRAATASAERMNRIFRRLVELLELEGATDADRSLGPVELSEVLRTLEDRWAPTALRRGKLLTVDVPAGVVAATSLGPLGRLLDELIDNAVLHAEPGPIHITTTVNDSIEIQIRDSGPGFDAAELAHLLAPFDVQSRDEAGSAGLALGLALASRYCGLAGAQLALKDDNGATVAAIGLDLWRSGQPVADSANREDV